MGLFEENYINYIRKRRYKLDIREFFENRERILMKNFDMLNLPSDQAIPAINESRITLHTSVNESKVHDISNIIIPYTRDNYEKQHNFSKCFSKIEVEDLDH